MPTIQTPAGDLTYNDSIRTISAQAYAAFNQAWVKQTGLATEGSGINKKLGQLGAFIGQNEQLGAVNAFNNLCEGLDLMEAGESLLAGVLAPCVVSIGDKVYTDYSPDGLKATAAAVLASGLGQYELQKAVDDLKKKLSES